MTAPNPAELAALEAQAETLNRNLASARVRTTHGAAMEGWLWSSRIRQWATPYDRAYDTLIAWTREHGERLREQRLAQVVADPAGAKS